MTTPKTFPQPMPRPVTQVLTADDLSDYEKEELAKLGWDGFSPLPSNLSEIMGEIPDELKQQAQIAASKLPDDFVLPTKGLDMFKVKHVTDPSIVQPAITAAMQDYAKAVAPPTPPQTVDKAAQARAQAFEQARQAGVQHAQAEQAKLQQAAAMSQGPQPEERIDIPPATVSDGSYPEEPQEQAAPAAQAPAKPKLTPAQQREEERKQNYEALLSLVNETDAKRYKTAVITGTMYEKSFEVFSGALRITFRDMGPEEDLLRIKQGNMDHDKGRYSRLDLASGTANSVQYSIAVMLREVHNVQDDVTLLDLPDSMTLVEYFETLDFDMLRKSLRGIEDNDTDLRVWYQYLTSHVIKGSLYRVVQKHYEIFREELMFLTQLSQFPEFFQTPAQTS